MKNRTKIPAAIGLAIAASLTLTACNDAGAAEALAQSQAELAAAHATLDAYNAVLAEAQAKEAAEAAEAEAASSATLINVEEIPLLTLENGWFTVGGEMMFDAVEAQSQSLADYTLGSNIPWWWGNGLFFLNPTTLTPFEGEHSSFREGVDFVIEVDPADFSDGPDIDWDSLNAHIRTYQDLQNGIPTLMALFDFPDVFYYRFTPVDAIEFSGIQAIALENDNNGIDIQFRFDNNLELVDAIIVEDEWGGSRIELHVNQGDIANQDTTWRLSGSASQELPTSIRIIDTATDTPLLWNLNVNSDGVNMLETRLIPELIEVAREFALQNGFSW